MMVLATGDTAYVIVGIGGSFFAFLGVAATVLWSGRKNRTRIEEVHEEVRSPNGTSTGKLNYENRKMLIELREQMVEIREAQLNGWKRAAEDVARADIDRARLETKVDHIGSTQDAHIARAEDRFSILFQHINLSDPHGSPPRSA